MHKVDSIEAAFRAEDWETLLALTDPSASLSADVGILGFFRVYAFVELGRLDEAYAILSQSVARFEPATRGKLWRRLASGLDDASRDVEAVELYRRSIEALPHHATAWILLGDVHSRAGELAVAAECFERATKCTQGDLDEAWLNLGLVHAECGRLQAAEQCLLRALEITPEYDEAREALLRVRRGNFGVPLA